MVALHTPICDFDRPAPDFALPDTDGRIWTRDQCTGKRGLLVMFICNHCPYVQAVRERIVRDARALLPLGIASVAIMSNDVLEYPEDGVEEMRRIAAQFDFPVPYLLDETQQVARVYGAICTPDFFGYNAELQLQYRGRLDESRKETGPAGARRDLFEAMKQVAETGRGPAGQIPSIGCSIKWRGN
jgi:peroxiredoxin